MGSLDYRLPKIIMKNTALLKQTLSEKVGAKGTDVAINQVHSAIADKVAVVVPTPSLSVVLTFSVPLCEVQPQIERIQALVAALGLQGKTQHQTRPLLVPPIESSQIVPTVDAIQATYPAVATMPVPLPSQLADVKGLSTSSSYRDNLIAPSTDKQQQLLQHLAIRKHLSVDTIKQILIDKYGVETGGQLSKKQASELISAWIVR